MLERQPQGDIEIRDGSFEKPSVDLNSLVSPFNQGVTYGSGFSIHMKGDSNEFKTSIQSNLVNPNNYSDAMEDFDKDFQVTQIDNTHGKQKEFIIKKFQRQPSNAHLYHQGKGQINIYNVNNGGDTVSTMQQQQFFRMSQQHWAKQSRQGSKRQQIRNKQKENNMIQQQNINNQQQQQQIQVANSQQSYFSNSNSQQQNPYAQNVMQYNNIAKKMPQQAVPPQQQSQQESQQIVSRSQLSHQEQVLPQQRKMARNTVYGVPFLDQQKPSAQVLGSSDYDQWNKVGSRATVVRQQKVQQEAQPGNSYISRPSESQQKKRTKVNRIGSAIEEVYDKSSYIRTTTEEAEVQKTKKIHQSQSSQHFPKPRAFSNNNHGNPLPQQQQVQPNNNNIIIQGNEDNFKIHVNREEKVINHLTKEVNPNLNLMFYDFNDYGQTQKQPQQPAYLQQKTAQQQPTGDRVPSRQNLTRGSRRGFTESQNKFYEQISTMSNEFTQRLGSPFPNFSKKSKVILPSIQPPQTIGSQGNTSNNLKQPNNNNQHSPLRSTSIGIVMEMIGEEDL